MLPLLRCFFAHLLILQYPDHHQNLISSSLYYSGPVHKISSQSVHNVLSNVVHRQTNKQTNKQTDNRQTDRQTDRQTNQCYEKHNLLCQGGNYCMVGVRHAEFLHTLPCNKYFVILRAIVFEFVKDIVLKSE